MPEPVTILLSQWQRERFVQIDAERSRIQGELAAISVRKDEALTSLIAASHDPAQFATWGIAIVADAIICTPPAEPEQAPE